MVALGAERDGLLQSIPGVLDSYGEGTHRRAMNAGKRLRETMGLMIENEINIALAVKLHVFRAMASDFGKTHLLKERAHDGNDRRCTFDEFKTVRSERILVDCDWAVRWTCQR